MVAPIVIVGTGLAGYSLAKELRKLDATVPIVMISRDSGDFYSKPMLSNALCAKKSAASLVLKSSVAMEEELRAQILTHTLVVKIELQARCLHLEGGRIQFYSTLVLAMGADPIRPVMAGNGGDSVLSVNDLDDFSLFEKSLAELDARNTSRNVLILGAGLIGCEFANDLLARGFNPTVVDVEDRMLARLLPSQASRRLQTRLETAGVVFRFKAAAVSVNRAADGLAVELSDGTAMRCDLILSAIGLKPRLGLAAQAGLAVHRGIITDEKLMTSEPGVFAIGDCAEVGRSVLPFVMPIMFQCRALAATLTGTPTAVKYPAMPVTVKTPACPTVICPPPVRAEGAWDVHETEDGLEALFSDSTSPDRVLGFAIQDKSISKRQQMAARVAT
ncbi:FAD-dependent oxidoreductase [Rugamonas apoptosis]|uniref:FAD-dependent oxidoreductase n=1 Tax=Rugamonas apoptosis TaxID=2758570 RepID=A0A7W2FC09_9BURK|nr:FAD-dependent oxidoreductase [Rugamonas apoptosis]MBA5688926.1 FAD-dependent oxidoreductase [Rugamonas apoptosis]